MNGGLPSLPTLMLPPPSSTMNSLQPPPRMADVSTKQPEGKVIVRLASDKKTLPANVPSPSVSTPSLGFSAPQELGSVDIQVVPTKLVGEPTKMQSMEITEPTKGKMPPSVPTLATRSEGVRVSVVEKDRVEQSLAPRTPELVKPKVTSVSQPVVLASVPDLDLDDKDHEDINHDATSSLPAVPVATSDLPKQLSSSSTTTRHISSDSVHSGSAAISKKAEHVGGAMVSMAPPAFQVSTPSPTSKNVISQKSETKGTSTFDAKWRNTTPIAIVEIECQSATALDIPGTIRAVAVESQDVCQVLHNDRTVSIVGNKEGSSLVQIWTNDIKDVPQVIRVNVSQPWQKPNNKASDLSDVKLAVAQAFPNANLKLSSKEDGTLEVRGTTETEEEARRVMEMVRKLCLVPVKDKVTISR
jgi:hypothetical protein